MNRDEILFGLGVSRIMAEAQEIEGSAGLLAGLRSIDPLSARYDLKASARSLRAAADKLDAIRMRGE